MKHRGVYWLPLEVGGTSPVSTATRGDQHGSHLIAAADDDGFAQQMAEFDPRDEIEGDMEIEEDPAAADVVAVAPTVPREPTLGEKENHSATGHAVFASWCEYCIAGRGREGGHYRQGGDENEWPKLFLDYSFLTEGGVHVKHADASKFDPH